MKFRHFTTLRTELDAQECIRRLAESMDPEEGSFLSLSGDKPMIGRIDGYEFYLHKRRDWRNTLAAAFYGSLVPRDSGTIIEGHFDLEPSVKQFMRFSCGVITAVGGVLFVLSLFRLLTGIGWAVGDPLFRLVAFLVLLLFGILLPRYGFWSRRDEEQSILECLGSTLAARIENPEKDTPGHVGR